jgi:tubulin-specific chaperone E
LRKSDKAASFIRPNRPSDPVRSIVHAIKFKYGGEDSTEFQNTVRKREIVPSHRGTEGKVIRISGKEAEEVGFDKIRKKLAHLEDLRIVLLDGLCISTYYKSADLTLTVEQEEEATAVGRICPNIQELDLSKNLWEHWSEIARVCKQLPKLATLRVEYVHQNNRYPYTGPFFC